MQDYMYIYISTSTVLMTSFCTSALHRIPVCEVKLHWLLIKGEEPFNTLPLTSGFSRTYIKISDKVAHFTASHQCVFKPLMKHYETAWVQRFYHRESISWGLWAFIKPLYKAALLAIMWQPPHLPLQASTLASHADGEWAANNGR